MQDPDIEECSWLFKIEAELNQYFYLFIIIKESIFINGNAFTDSMLFMEKKVCFFNYKSNFLRLWTLFWSFFINIQKRKNY